MSTSGMATPLDMIEAHLRWMRAGRYAVTTTRDAGQLLRRLHRELPEGLHAAIGDELAGWLANDGWSEQTASRYYKDIVRFYRWATRGDDPWLSFDPSVGLRRPTARPGLPRPAGHDLVQAAIYDLPEPWRLVCRLVALAGLRPGEVATLTRADVTDRVITIKGKGGKTRSIPTHPLIWATVASRPPGRLVTRRDGRPADADYISKRGAYHLRRAGHPTTLYPLRHFFGTTIQERYRDARVTQELMGHASLATTQNYTLVTSQRMREAIDCLPFGAAPAPPAPPVAPPPAARPVGRSTRRRQVHRSRP